MIETNKFLDFYLQTSMYTYLGPYEEVAKALPNDIVILCNLQRMQTLHPSIFQLDNIETNKKNDINKEMELIPKDRLNCEEDIFQTAISIFAELLRRNPEYSVKRRDKDKIHILCRGNAILLAGILKAKNIPARVRCGFAKYHYDSGLCDDQWNTEYYDYKKKRWVMVDSRLDRRKF